MFAVCNGMEASWLEFKRLIIINIGTVKFSECILNVKNNFFKNVSSPVVYEVGLGFTALL